MNSSDFLNRIQLYARQDNVRALRLTITTGVTKTIETAARNHGGSIQAIYYAMSIALETICNTLGIAEIPPVKITEDEEAINAWIGEEGRTIDDQIDIWLEDMRERAIRERQTDLNNLFSPGDCQQLRTSCNS